MGTKQPRRGWADGVHARLSFEIPCRMLVGVTPARYRNRRTYLRLNRRVEVTILGITHDGQIAVQLNGGRSLHYVQHAQLCTESAGAA